MVDMHGHQEAETPKRKEDRHSRDSNGDVRPKTPESAGLSTRRWQEMTYADRKRMGVARDELHATLDALGGRCPGFLEVISLLRLAADGHPPFTAAGRIVRVLSRYIGQREEQQEPEYRGPAVS